MKQIEGIQSTYLGVSESTRFLPILRSLGLGLALTSYAAHALAAATYTITDFSTVGPSPGFVPVSIKANGQILGYIPTPIAGSSATTPSPWLYNMADGSLTDMQSIVGGIFSSASGINEKGQAIGQVTLTGSTTGVSPNVYIRNADGTVVDLGNFTGAKTYSRSFGLGINDAGQVFGNSIAQSLCDGRAFVGTIDGTGLQPLGTLGGGAYDWTYAYGMNASGQVAGRSSPNGACLLSDTWHAFAGKAGSLIDLQMPGMPPINPGSGGSTAFAINDTGIAVGEYPYAFGAATRVFPGGAPQMHAVVWDTTNSVYTDLGKPNVVSSLRSINSSGQAVGSENAYAAIGSAASGSLTNLNTLISGIPAGWTFVTAYNISDAGQILATAKDATGIYHYALLSPSAPPVVPFLAAPANLTSATASSSQVDLTWSDNAPTETAQYLERCQGAACTSFVQIASLAPGITSYSDTALSPGTTYSYRVKAHGTTSDSAYSNISTATTTSLTVVTPPLAPTGLASSAISQNRVVLSWVDNATDEQNYLIERCKGTACINFVTVASVTANVTTYSDSGLSRNRSYSYRVRASNVAGNSAYSNTLNVRTLR